MAFITKSGKKTQFLKDAARKKIYTDFASSERYVHITRKALISALATRINAVIEYTLDDATPNSIWIENIS